MADKLKLTPEEQWLEKAFSLDFAKAFAKELAKDSARKDLDARIAAFHARWDDYAAILKFINHDKDAMKKCDGDTLARKARDDAGDYLTDAKKDAHKGDIFAAHLNLDSGFGEIEKHIIMNKYPFNLKSKRAK